jgi:hypothetical protein
MSLDALRGNTYKVSLALAKAICEKPGELFRRS